MKKILLAALFTLTASTAFAQNKPVTFSVTLTAEQVEALHAEFGEEVDLPAKTRAWVNDWLVQFTRNLDEKEAREIIDSLKTAKPEDAAEVKKRLKLKVKK